MPDLDHLRNDGGPPVRPAAVPCIAHDLNNVLMQIGCEAELLAVSHPGDAEVQKRTANILAAIAAATRLTQQLQSIGEGGQEPACERR